MVVESSELSTFYRRMCTCATCCCSVFCETFTNSGRNGVRATVSGSDMALSEFQRPHVFKVHLCHQGVPDRKEEDLTCGAVSGPRPTESGACGTRLHCDAQYTRLVFFL